MVELRDVADFAGDVEALRGLENRLTCEVFRIYRGIVPMSWTMEPRLRNIQLICLAASLIVPLCCTAQEPAEAKPSPREVLSRLQQGNLAYVAGKQSVAQVTPARRRALITSQHPRTVILTCSDSRVPPEYIFNEGLGELFVVRVAGAVADPVTVGSVEYGVEHLHAPLIVVMGHTRGGAVKAALDTPAPTGASTGPDANIESILALIRPGILRGAASKDPWSTAVYGGVNEAVADMFRISKIVPEMSKHGEVGVIGAVYEIETGKVKFSEMITKEAMEHSAGPGGLLEWKTAPGTASTHPSPKGLATIRQNGPATGEHK